MTDDHTKRLIEAAEKGEPVWVDGTEGRVRLSIGWHRVPTDLGLIYVSPSAQRATFTPPREPLTVEAWVKACDEDRQVRLDDGRTAFAATFGLRRTGGGWRLTSHFIDAPLHEFSLVGEDQ